MGKNNLYRSYHPFKKSRPKHPLEDQRITMVQKLISDKNINSIINLSDTNESIPAEFKCYKNMLDNAHILFTNKGYNYDVFYYISGSDEFSNLIRRIINFILEPSNKTPFLIHCRIGTDRTGIIIAILAAFMGAEWKDIVIDYQKSNNLGIGEYRDEKLIEYAFKEMLGANFRDKNLEKLITDYFKNRLNLNNDKLQKLKDKLS
ncbi:tyrosine-protein phosphatase [Orenia marismortui]|uniref:Tyrosine phosphatase family protein n=1 Tax=Orenia marismortui TaxID=46469 RepID=A0A4R8GRB3_9FIRM|nr:tyrosine-protein phosphatase [Orenia marismortui]TDX48399.1 tyrosine phosphatase family protein [Orenia marismortui]